jgi:hypothetical protein
LPQAWGAKFDLDGCVPSLHPKMKLIKACTIVLPWGKYEYLRLPMGLCNSPNIFQEKMSELMVGLEFVRAYIDNLLVLVSKGNFATHLEHLEHVFTRLVEAGLKVNATKGHFCCDKLEYLGYLINRKGVCPTLKKVEAITNIAPPSTTRKQLRSFFGMVNYYMDMWPKRAHLLAPLSTLTSAKVTWKLTDKSQPSFDTMKRLIARETFLTYPPFNKGFEIHTGASKAQLGACISEGKPVAFYSRKLNPAQTRYTTTEPKLLSIVETLKEFRNILLVQEIIVHTTHKNLTYRIFNLDRSCHALKHSLLKNTPLTSSISKGEENVVADALSQLPTILAAMQQNLTCPTANRLRA